MSEDKSEHTRYIQEIAKGEYGFVEFRGNENETYFSYLLARNLNGDIAFTLHNVNQQRVILARQVDVELVPQMIEKLLEGSNKDEHVQIDVTFIGGDLPKGYNRFMSMVPDSELEALGRRVKETLNNDKGFNYYKEVVSKLVTLAEPINSFNLEKEIRTDKMAKIIGTNFDLVIDGRMILQVNYGHRQPNSIYTNLSFAGFFVGEITRNHEYLFLHYPTINNEEKNAIDSKMIECKKRKQDIEEESSRPLKIKASSNGNTTKAELETNNGVNTPADSDKEEEKLACSTTILRPTSKQLYQQPEVSNIK